MTTTSEDGMREKIKDVIIDVGLERLKLLEAIDALESFAREGFKEGQEDIRKACSQHQHDQYSQGFQKGRKKALEEFRKDFAEMLDIFPLDSKIAAVAVNTKKIIDRLISK